MSSDTPNEEPVSEEAWLEEPDGEELPRRPRRRLFGSGGNPVFLALLGVLLIACGFIGGALVEKGQTSSSSNAGTGTSGLAARFAALRGGTSGTSSGATGTAGGGGAGAGAGGELFGRSGGAGGAGATTGQVAYISGSTLYVTNAEGNTVKVRTSPASTVTKTVQSDVRDIHPGETVVITGGAGAHGTISAESIRVGAGGGLGGLFGGSSGGSGAGGGRSSGGGSGEPALFGKGG